MQLPIRTRRKKKWKSIAVVLFCAAAVCYALWATSGFVLAFRQIKRAHIFPTTVNAVGWSGGENALVQELSPQAPFVGFTRGNSAYIILATSTGAVPAAGGAPSAPSTPINPPTDTTPPATTTPPSDTNPPTQSTSTVPDTATSTDTVPPPFPQDAPLITPTTDAPVNTDNATTSMLERAVPVIAGTFNSLASFTLSHLVTVVFATTSGDSSDTTSSTTDAQAPSDTSGAPTPPDTSSIAGMATCNVLGTTCHTIEFENFNVGGSMLNKEFQRAELNFSFANLATEADTLDGKLTVRYFHAGHWRSAGEIYLNKELSNSANGGYFTQTLDDITSWSDLSDVKVVFEYEPGDGTGPVQLYLDSVWLDGVYVDPVQDVLSGDVSDPTDAPQNVSFSLLQGEKDSNTLILADGDSLFFPYLDTLTDDTLMIRSDHSSYAAAQPDNPTVVYTSITNMGKNADNFTLYASFPGAKGTVSDISQYLRNVPDAATTTQTSDVTYLCDGGWQSASTSGQYMCPATQQTYSCSSLSDTGTNCLVSNMPVGVATSTSYTSAWVSTDFSASSASDRTVQQGLSPGYAIAYASDKSFQILPGQTLYFRVTMVTPDSDKARFVLSAKGSRYFGDLDSLHLRDETYLSAQAKVQKPKPKHDTINDQISDESDFSVDQLPQFRFKFKTQRSFFTQVKDFLTQQSVSYKVQSAQLRHASGEVEHLPVDIQYGQDNDWTLQLEKQPRAFRPGKYSLDLSMQEGASSYTDTVAFYWGVLALNTDKSSYEPGETAHLSIAALDDNGDTMCDAQLALSITDPSGNTSDVPVVSGGGCGQNNITTLPDFVADYPTTAEGTYTYLLSRLNDAGDIVTSTAGSFSAAQDAPYVVARDGPTRIFPSSAYQMHVSVEAAQGFVGQVVETLPEGFTVGDDDGATLSRANGVINLTWNVALSGGVPKSFSYTFKAPEVSPYIYLLGPLTMNDGTGVVFTEKNTWKIASDATSIATGVAWLAGDATTNSSNISNASAFPLSWDLSADYDSTYFSYSSSSPSQLAINTPGDYLVAVTVPFEATVGSALRTSIETDIRVNGAKVNMGVSRGYIRTNGTIFENSDHLYMLLHGLNAGDYIESYVHNLSTQNDTVLIGTQASMYAEYIGSDQNVYSGLGTTTSNGTNLNPAASSTVVWYDDATLGRKDSNYTHSNTAASSTITLGAAGPYMVFVNIPLDGAVTAASPQADILLNGINATGAEFKQGYIANSTGVTDSSLQFSGVVVATTTNVNLKVNLIAGGAAGTVTALNDTASIYIQQLPGSGIYLATATSTANNKTTSSNWNVAAATTTQWTNDLIKDSAMYVHSTSTRSQQITAGSAGDYLLTLNDSHAGATNATNETTQVVVNGTQVNGAQTKSHDVYVTASGQNSSGSLVYLLRNLAASSTITVTTVLDATAGTITEDQPALLMLWHKSAQSNFIQDTEHWYANVNGEPPTDAWPAGGINLNEGDAITTGNSVKSGDVLRLRMSLTANVTTIAGADSFKLQYAPGTECSPALAWTDVGAIGSGSVWRGYDNASVTAGATLSTTTISIASTTETYEEQNPSAATPNPVTAGTDAEWDWALQDNGATAGTSYCFRMVQSSGQSLKDYNDYPQLVTNNTPNVPTLETLFDNEKTGSTTPFFTFTSSDDNGEDIHYGVQVSTDPAFGTTVIDDDSVSSFSKFNDTINVADKAPFSSGNNVQYTPTISLTSGTTYWWRVRAKDPSGTNSFSDYSPAQSFTVGTASTSIWFQSTSAQFGEDVLTQVATTGTDDIRLSGANTTGTVWSPEIDFSEATVGNAWGNFTWTDSHASGTILYSVEYLTATSSWAAIPNTDLPGNSSGTSTQPIKLSTLDPATYPSIRLRANFTRVTNTPILFDWTLGWSRAVFQPTLSSPFDNEKVPTTTPTFQFTTTEPTNNSLVYQIQWSTSATFASAVSSSTSDTGAGFADTASSTASSPFPSGDAITYTIPNANRLASSTTFWWRVRAKAPSGGNTFSLWSNPESFTTDTTVQSSTWFQKTLDQFNNDALTLTIATSTGVTASSDTGKIAIYRAAAAAESITTALFTNGFDTNVRQDDIYSKTGTTTINLNKGYYAVLYGVRFDSTGGTNRAVMQTDLNLGGQSLATGWSQGFIRDNGGSLEALSSGGGIINVASDNTPLKLQSFRTDTNPTELVARVANTAGIQLVRLDSGWPYVRLSKSVKQTGPVSASWVKVQYDREDEINAASFTHSTNSGDVTLVSPGHYLVFANTYGSLPTASTNDTMVDQKLTLNGSDIEGSFTTVYMRGTNGTSEGAASIGMILESTSSNAVLSVQLARSLGTAAWSIDSNAAGTYVNRSALTVVKLPEADFIRLQNSTNTQNLNPAALTALTWNTESEKDTASFVHSTVTNPSRIQANLAGDYLLLTSNYSNSTPVANTEFNQGWRLTGGTLIQYGQTIGYNDTTATHVGNWSGNIFPNVVSTNYFEVVAQALGTAGNVLDVHKGVQGVRIASLNEADTNPKSVQSPDIVFTNGTGPKWSTFSWTDTRPGASSIMYQLQYLDASSSYSLVPDSALPGNSTGFSTTSSSVNISNLSRVTYNTLRTLATFTCAGGVCPTLNTWTVNWSQGINVSGTAKQFDQTTNVTSGTVAVAVNGVLQTGKTGVISAGTWTISNVTAFTGDIITVFVSTTSPSARAVAVTQYTTTNDVTGMSLYQNHLTLGSDDNPTLTNTNISQYDNSVATPGGNGTAVFDDVSGGNLSVCAISGCTSARLLIKSGTTFEPSSASTGNVTTPNIQIDGTLIADGNTLTVSHSWVNNQAFVKGGSTVIFSATSTNETINSSLATSSAAFNNVTFGQGSGSATWTLLSPLSASSTFAVNFGTLQNGTNTLTLSGDLTIGSSGIYSHGSGSTTFAGSGTNIWTDNSAGQDMGDVIVDGTSKTIQLGSAVKATNITIGSNDTLNTSGSGFGITVLGNWTNNNLFVPQSGTVTFAATTTGKTIIPGTSGFNNVTFNGVGGNWAFSGGTATIGNNFTVTNGTVTLPTGTTTIAGSFDGSGGTFLHNNGTVLFTASSAKTINPGTSSFFDVAFNGSGSWSFTSANATSSRNTTIAAGAVTMPSGILAIGGSFANNGGSFTHNSGTLKFTASTPQTLKLNGSSAFNLLFAGSGSWSFVDSSAIVSNTITFQSGATTLPSGTLSVGGSFVNSGGSFANNSGTVLFNASATGKSVTPGSSSFANLTFDNPSGGWTITNNATSTANTTINNAASLTVLGGTTLSVGGTFTNAVGGSATNFATSTLVLNSGTNYTINTKSTGGDAYGVLSIGASTNIRMWGSSAATTTVNASGSLYSQNHAGVSGALNIYGAFASASNEYWSFANDFDGTALGGGSRQAQVRIASSSSVTFSGGTLQILGSPTASTTIQNQGAGNYALSVTGGTLNAQYYSIASTSAAGLSLSGSTTVTSLANGSFTLSIPTGGTMMTVAAQVINTNPLLQIQQVSFATSTGVISGFNVTETGTPSPSTLYWWFRNHYGNFAGEGHNNDPGGNPGFIRWDDSGYNITVAGHVYSDHGSTLIGNPPCDGSTAVVTIVAGTTTYSGACGLLTGGYSISGVQFTGDVDLVAYLNTNGGKKAVTVTKTPTASIADMDLYQNSLIVRHEGVTAATIADLSGFDSAKDSDVFFSATTTGTPNISMQPGSELYLWGGKTFVPGGNVSLAGSSTNAWDGRLYLAPNSTLTAAGAQTYTIGGGLFVGTGATLTAASSTFTFTATSSSKSISSAQALTLNNIIFNGSGGQWSLDSGGGILTTVRSLTMAGGTLVGTGDMTVQTGDVTGSGTIAMTGGTFLISSTGNVGSANSWQFKNLTLGDGVTANTTTKTGAGTTTVTGTLTVAANQTLNAGTSPWALTGGGTPFVISGSFNVQSAPFIYSATTATNVANATYAALTLAPSAAGSPTYILGGGTPTIGSLTVGDGTNGVTVTADTNDPSIALTGDMKINANATYIASNVGALTVGGNWLNSGTFTNSGSSVLFNATTTGKTVSPGLSPFFDLAFNSSSGGWTITTNATSTHDTTLSNAASFTLASSTTLSVGGTFTNLVGGSATTWASSTLALTSGSYTINTKSAGGDVYGTLSVGASTNIRMWGSSAATTTVNSSGSLYSQNHAGVNGALNIYGAYSRSSGSDFWSDVTDFDGTDISGSPRKVNVSIASSSALTFSGGVLDIIGVPMASTTITNQGVGTYSMSVSGGTLFANFYEFRNLDANGLNISGSPTITSLSNGDFLLSQAGATTMTVAGSVIDANPLKIIKTVNFATTSAITGFNVKATGSTGSSWKFNLHYGNLAGERFDSDPAGDPGFIRWDDSASQITISGTVYSDEGSTTMGTPTCNGSTQNVKLVVEGGTSYTSSCNSSTGAYSISGVSFNPGDTLTLYLDTNGGTRAANISVDPISNISGMDLYQNRVIVRHEDTVPITIADIAEYNSTNDSDVPFTTTIAATSTLTLPPNTKLIVWTGKTFAPAGNVTIQSGGGVNSYDGTLEVQSNAVFSAAGTQAHSIGGNLLFDSGSSLVNANSTFTFTATTTGKTITPPASSPFYNLTFNGSGGNWAFSGNATTTNNFTISTGVVTLPTGVLAVGGTFNNSGGSFLHNNGTLLLNATASGKTLTFATSTLFNLTFNGTGGGWTFNDTNATTSNNFTITAGGVTLPAGTLALGSSFQNAGTFTSGAGTVKFTASASGKNILASGSSFNSVLFNGAGGGWTFLDTDATTGNFTIATGTVVLPAGTLSVGGSFINSGGAFTNNSGTVLFNASATGKSVTPGSSSFYNMNFGSASGGWTITTNATSTHDTTLSNAASFTLASSTTLSVGGTFTNLVGGSATTWASSTLALTSGSYTINTKSAGGDVYGTLSVGASTNIRMWGSSAATTTVNSSGSLYSQNHAGVNGALNIYGAYSRSSGSDFWDFATDFDGAALGGGSRQVNVNIATSSSVTLTGGVLDIVGGPTATTTVQNQGVGAYSLSVSGGTLNALYYQIRNTDASGLNLTGSPTISSMANGDFQLAQSGATMVTLAGSVIDANASLHITGVKFATSSGVTSGFNVKLTGSTLNAWTFSQHYGNYAGEAFDSDGADACGNIRWDDSSCLFVNQAHYRWRNDDGGEGALATQWFNASWSNRKKIAVSNSNATSYTNYPVKLAVAYDAAMKSDFSDLRFTDSSGTTSIPYYIEGSTASASSTVWVKIPSLPASGSATIYMYFGNAAASDASDGANTFAFFDSFESGSLASYSGDTATKFNIGTSFAHNGTNGLDAGTHFNEKTVNGIFRTGSQTAQGQTIRFFEYVDASQQDEPCTLFGVQSAGHNYALCLDEYPVPAIEIAKDITSNDGSGTVLASTTVSYTTGWYEVSIDWLPTNAINATIYNSSGAVFATLNTTSSSYTSGGLGFSYWFQHGGWDFYSSRQYAANAPTAIFGASQSSNGATWAAAEDAVLSVLNIGQNIRLRFSVQNTGSPLVGQLFRLQFAPKGAALNCESVSPGSYIDVPTISAGCGSREACMTSSSQFTNLSSTSPSLTYPPSMNFAAGEIMEDPSNQTNGIPVGNNTETEVEYNFQMTSNATGNQYCFRTSQGGSALASYDHVAQATVLHAPSVGTVHFNGGNDIALTEGTTTTIIATSTVTDLNGFADMLSATSTFYRSGVSGTSNCSADNNNCYQLGTSSCSFSACAGTSCTLTCSAPVQYFADPTDAGSALAAQNWFANMTVTDSTNLTGSLTSGIVDVLTLYGLSINTGSIAFPSTAPGGDTGSTVATTTVQNSGNSVINIQLAGTDLSSGASSIPVGQQKYATSTFIYGSCALCQFLTGTSTNVSINIAKPSSTSTPSTGNVFWGIGIPVGTAAKPYSGTNTFIATGP